MDGIDPRSLFENMSISKEDIKFGTMQAMKETVSEKGMMNIRSAS